MTAYAVLGTGGWGTAIAHLLAARGFEARLWGRDPNYVAELARTRLNARALPGERLHEGIRLVSDPRESVAGAAAVFVAIPTQFLRATLPAFAGEIRNEVPLVSGVKGLEVGTLRRPSEIFAEILGPHRLAVLSGPSHAEEIVQGLPASLAIASADLALARALRDALSSPALRLYATEDALGVELAGALKNVMAIAAGAADGLRLGDNAKAALVTRALAEMARYGVARGARAETYAGLAGLGDLLTTCYSPHGRNRRLGERLARGETLAAILASTTQVSEGVWTAKALFESHTKTESRERLAADLPICAEVFAIVHEAKDPRRSVVDLMTRPPRE